MKKIILASLLLAATTATQAATLELSSSGVFTNPEGPSSADTSGEGTNTFYWGTPAGNTYSKSRLKFISSTASVDVAPNDSTDFLVGKLKYRNGNNWSSTIATGVDLGITLSITNPFVTDELYTFDLDLTNSLNTFTPLGNSSNADTVSFSQEIASDLFSHEGINYSFQLLYMQRGQSVFNDFFVDEERTRTAQLIGRITAVSAVPVPAAAFLFAPALLGFMGLRRKAKKSVA